MNIEELGLNSDEDKKHRPKKKNIITDVFEEVEIFVNDAAEGIGQGLKLPADVDPLNARLSRGADRPKRK